MIIKKKIYQPLTSQANTSHMVGEMISVSLKLKPTQMNVSPILLRRGDTSKTEWRGW